MSATLPNAFPVTLPVLRAWAAERARISDTLAPLGYAGSCSRCPLALCANSLSPAPGRWTINKFGAVYSHPTPGAADWHEPVSVPVPDWCKTFIRYVDRMAPDGCKVNPALIDAAMAQAWAVADPATRGPFPLPVAPGAV